MLPQQLSGNLCAFLVGKERLAVSVLVTLDAEGQVIEYEIQPTAIQVDYQLSYNQAQAILERNNSEPAVISEPSAIDIQDFAPIFDLLDNVAAVSQVLKEQRRQRGAFELNLPEKPG